MNVQFKQPMEVKGNLNSVCFRKTATNSFSRAVASAFREAIAKASVITPFLIFILVSSSAAMTPAAAAVPANGPSDTLAQQASTDSDRLFSFDSEWKGNNPFVERAGGFELPVKMGAGTDIHFPSDLDARSPIVLRTAYGTIHQYLVSDEKLHGRLQGRYLVYQGRDRAILYRYDSDQRQLREFVYLPDETVLAQDGVVVRWRFEGGQFKARGDGGVAVVKKYHPLGEIRGISDDSMAERIGRFIEKRRGGKSSQAVQDKTLFVIPPPVYVDAKGNEVAEGIDYRIYENSETYALNGEGNSLHLVLGSREDLVFPLWADPTLTADADADLIVNGQDGSDQLGYSVASAGDFNGDGVDDVIVGARSDDNSGRDSGSAFIFFGGAPGTITAPDTEADVVLNGRSMGDAFGFSVASAGDFNGDGLGDVIVGAPMDDNNGGSSGSAYIFFGGRTGTVIDPDAEADVVLTGQSAGDQFGSSVASAGDFNDDGWDDVIVGAWQDDNAGSASGSAFIFFGGPGVTGTITAPDVQADVVLNGQNASDAFGFSVASAGDFNGDGVGDVVVGARSDDNAGSASGSAFIYFGGVAGTISDPDTNADVVLNGQSGGDLFGWSVASAGDFNGDGLGDVIVGARRDDNGGTESGSAFIFFGGVLGTIGDPDTHADVVLNGQSAGDEFGYSVASAGDFNGDGMDDVIVGAWRDDNNGTNAGSAFVFFGGVTGTFGNPDVEADVVLNGQSAGDEFGYSVASAGNSLGDEAHDVIVGARSDANNGASSGSAFLFVGEVQNQPPVADAGSNQFVEQQGPAGSSVVLDGSGSSDPDGDSLTYTWAGPFGSAEGMNPTVLIPAGIHALTLTVSDGRASDSASVVITVDDTTAPVLSQPADITVEATSAGDEVVNFEVPTATDAVDGTTAVSCDPASGSSFPMGETTVTCTSADLSGNAASVGFLVTVSDTTSPDVTASLDPVSGGSGQRLSVAYSASDVVDPSPVVEALLAIAGSQQMTVSSGEVIEYERGDVVEVKRKGDVLWISGPTLELQVNATDFSSNRGTAKATPPEVEAAPTGYSVRWAKFTATRATIWARCERLLAQWQELRPRQWAAVQSAWHKARSHWDAVKSRWQSFRSSRRWHHR